MKRSPLKRGTPLQATETLLRRVPLRAKADARTSSLRGSVLDREAEIERTAPLVRKRTKRRRTISRTIRDGVAKRSRGRCVVCGGKGAKMTCHHVLPVREWPDLERVADNMVLVCWEPCHANHEAAHRRIRWAELPECAVTLAYATSGAAAMFLERTYPRV